eukprot:GILK01005422.1.p1 GENE.GILK01005422.1~~GILK01005422.1.p1  ORF type:complete len:289 (-),score=37.31 GILK01005422.1:338-1204(-)
MFSFLTSILISVLNLLYSVSWIKKWGWKIWYNMLARGAGSRPAFTFMNYGYTSSTNNAVSTTVSSEFQNELLPANLYRYTATAGGKIALLDKVVLEVGSGRGGGAAYLCQTHGPKLVLAVDYSFDAVMLARTIFPEVSGLSFLQGDAEHLPFGPETFDVLVNVESSHCYPHFEKFVSEAARVLRKGGFFTFADFRQKEDMQQTLDCLSKYFTVVESEYITEGVLQAMNLEEARKRWMIERNAPKNLPPFITNLLLAPFKLFAGLNGTAVNNALKDGSWQYVRVLCSKQ